MTEAGVSLGPWNPSVPGIADSSATVQTRGLLGPPLIWAPGFPGGSGFSPAAARPERPGGRGRGAAAGSVRAHLTLRRPGTPTRESGRQAGPRPPPPPLRSTQPVSAPQPLRAPRASRGQGPAPGPRSRAAAAAAFAAAAASQLEPCEPPEAGPSRSEPEPPCARPRRGCSPEARAGPPASPRRCEE